MAKHKPSKAVLALNPEFYAKTKIPRSFEALQKTPQQTLKERRHLYRDEETLAALAQAARVGQRTEGQIREEAREYLTKASSLERAFLRAFLRVCGPSSFIHPRWEYRFHPARRWRFDFAWPDARVYVELDGGTWIRGRHSRGGGTVGDCSKHNAATLDGWVGFKIPTGGVSLDLVKDIHDFIRDRQHEQLAASFA